MPFQSEKQRRFLWATRPDIAKKWADKYPESNKGLPMYANDKSDQSPPKEKAAQTTIWSLFTKNEGGCTSASPSILPSNSIKTSKQADSKQEQVDIPRSEKPVYAGEEREKGLISSGNDLGDKNNESCGPNAINELLQKLSVVLAPKIEQTMENLEAEREGRVPRRVGNNAGLKQYPVATPQIPLPMGMQQAQASQQPQQTQQTQQTQPSSPTPVGAGQSTATTDPIKFHSGLSASGVINGNAALSAPNTVNTKISSDGLNPDTFSPSFKSLMGAGLFGRLGLRTGLGLGLVGGGLHGAFAEPREYIDAKGKKQKQTRLQKVLHDALTGGGVGGLAGGAIGAVGGASLPFLPKSAAAGDPVLSQLTSIDHCSETEMLDLLELETDATYLKAAANTPAWQRAAGKNDEGGLNAKGRASYNKATGGNLKAPVTEKNPTGERDKRQNSFCSRMCGMKRVNTGSKTKKDPDSRINKALRKWNCKCGSFENVLEKWSGDGLSMAPIYGALLGAAGGAVGNAMRGGTGNDVGRLWRYATGTDDDAVYPGEFPSRSLDSLGRNMAEGAVLGGGAGVGYDVLRNVLTPAAKPAKKKKPATKSAAESFGKKAAKRVLNLSPSWGGQKWQLGEWGLNPQAGYRYLGGVVPTPDIALRLGGPMGGTAVGLAPFPYVETDWGRPSGRQANKETRSLYKWIGDGMRDRPTAAAHALANVPEDATPEDYEAAMRSSGVGYSSKELKRLAERMATMGPLQLPVE